MRATVMHKARDVRIEDVPDAADTVGEFRSLCGG
jgi:hypothetical protein